MYFSSSGSEGGIDWRVNIESQHLKEQFFIEAEEYGARQRFEDIDSACYCPFASKAEMIWSMAPCWIKRATKYGDSM
jgi:hypothetical protein